MTSKTRGKSQFHQTGVYSYNGGRSSSVLNQNETPPPCLPPSSWTNWIPFACSGLRRAGDRVHTHNICRAGRLSCPVYTHKHGCCCCSANSPRRQRVAEGRRTRRIVSKTTTSLLKRLALKRVGLRADLISPESGTRWVG